MTDLAMSRRAVTRALAALSVTSIPTMAIANAAPMLPREVCGDMAGDVEQRSLCITFRRRQYVALFHDGIEAASGAPLAIFQPSGFTLLPAPNLEALHWKLGQTFEADGEIALWSERIALTIRSDFMRLLPGEMAS